MSDYLKDLEDSALKNVTLLSVPTDYALLKQAQDAKEHLGSKAVHAEYSRLVLQKYHRPPKRGFWSRRSVWL
jgi:hypothetical protein